MDTGIVETGTTWTDGSGDTASTVPHPGSDVGELPPEPCLALEGNGCSLGGCTPPSPRCEDGGGTDGVGPGSDSGLGEWVGSPSSACGCGDAGLGAPWWPGLLLILLARRRGRALLAVLLVLWAPVAGAVDVDRMTYSDGRGWAALVDGDTGRPWQTRAALSTSVLSKPLVARYSDGVVSPVVNLATTAAFGASVTFDPRIRLGLVLPVHPVTLDGGGELAILTPGDATLSLAIPLSEDDRRLQVAWNVGAEIPTGDPARFAGGHGSAVGTLAARVATGPRAGVGAALGVRLRPDERLSTTRWGNAVEYGLAGAVQPLEGLETALEAFGSLGLQDDTRASLPLEWLATGRWPADGAASVRIGAGGGIGRGLGNPRLRAVLAVELASGAAKDTDGDGWADPRDLCRRRPEDRDRFRDLDGCPDEDDDRDGIPDVEDACRLEPETVNGWSDEDGCPDARAELLIEVGPSSVETATVRIDGEAPFVTLPDQDRAVVTDPGLLRMEVTADGFVPQQVVRTVGEGPTRILVRLEVLPAGTLTVRVRDEEGTPVPARVRVVPSEGDVEADGGSVEAAQGEVVVPYAAGPVAVVAEADGFAEERVLAEAPVEGTVDVEIVLHRLGVALVGRAVVLGDQVRFAVDSADPTPDTDPALDALARWLAEHPEIELLRVEGHADDLGSPRYNLDLSQRRAESVVAALVRRGVAAERLVALGSGESVRLSQPHSDRVVDFLVVVWDEEAADRPIGPP